MSSSTALVTIWSSSTPARSSCPACRGSPNGRSSRGCTARSPRYRSPTWRPCRDTGTSPTRRSRAARSCGGCRRRTSSCCTPASACASVGAASRSSLATAGGSWTRRFRQWGEPAADASRHWTREPGRVSIRGQPLPGGAMEPSAPTTEQVFLETLRRHRADLRGSINALEQALAAPAPGRRDAWAQRVHVALVELSADVREHIDITERPDGLYRALLMAAPRLSNAVTRLTREHGQVTELVDDLLAFLNGPEAGEVDRVRDLGTALLGKLVRHRQRGSDLVWEAYAVDIGGET